MDRKSFSSVLDEAVGQLDGEVRSLRNQQVTLNVNIKDLESRRDKLSAEILQLEKKHSFLIKDHKDEVDAMVINTQEKLANANKKDAEASNKLFELNEKIKEADNLIKSNKGLNEGLIIQDRTIEKRISKLEELFKQIKEV